MSTRKGIACLAHECCEVLDFDPQAVDITIRLANGERLRVSRKKIKVGPKGGMKTVTKQVREDIAALLASPEVAAARDKHDTGDDA